MIYIRVNFLKFWFFFIVLQECATDSEELIYPIRSTCSAPPDLLMTSDREPLGTHKMSHNNNHHRVLPKDVKIKTKSVDGASEADSDNKLLLEVSNTIFVILKKKLKTMCTLVQIFLI